MDYTNGMKGYTLWCTDDSRSLKIFISRDISFDESAMLNQKKESIDNANIDCGIGK